MYGTLYYILFHSLFRKMRPTRAETKRHACRKINYHLIIVMICHRFMSLCFITSVSVENKSEWCWSASLTSGTMMWETLLNEILEKFKLEKETINFGFFDHFWTPCNSPPPPPPPTHTHTHTRTHMITNSCSQDQLTRLCFMATAPNVANAFLTFRPSCVVFITFVRKSIMYATYDNNPEVAKIPKCCVFAVHV